MRCGMYFDQCAKSFDTDKRRARAKVIADAMRRHMGGHGGVAMDFGCGTGLVGLELADLFASVTFVDSSQGMIVEVG